MSQYHAPLKEMQFVLKELAGLEQVGRLPGFEDATSDTVAAILAEAAKFATEVLDPLNAVGDREGARRLDDGSVKTPTGFKDAYLQYCANGWNGLTKISDFGGQGLPQLVATPVEEMWHAANMAFDLCPLLTQGAIEAIELCGTPEQKELFLPKMVSGEWAGTMNLTESQAGSDLAAVRTRAVPQPDGSFKLSGQKIFITYGEHDYTVNIIHLVLARTPTAPEGVKGISLFIVPKFLINADGSLGLRNDVQCVSLEHKLGIHASPTAVLAYGDHGGAVGYLIGQENRGLEYMFIMMNLARFSVGLEGVGIAERAYQRAAAYAKERVQGRAVGEETGAKAATIIQHPDVRRMLLSMKAQTEATRAAQHYRDARIITIYEGTTGIQANDLIGRKTARDGGKTALAVIAEMQKLDGELGKQPGAEFAAIRSELAAAATARFYADYHLPQAAALKHAVVTAGESVLALADEQF